MNNNYFSNDENHNLNSGIPFSTNKSNRNITQAFSDNYIFNLLKKNIGKLGTFYFTFPSSNEYRDKSFKGILEDVGKDYILMSDSTNGKWYMFVLFYLDYVAFEEEINK